MGKSRLDIIREKAANKAKREIELKSTTTTTLPKKPKKEAKSKLIPDSFRPGQASLTPKHPNYDALLKKFIEEYKLLVSKKKRGVGSRRGSQDNRDHVLSINKEKFVVPLVRGQMSEIRKRFGKKLSERAVVDSTYNILSKKLRKIAGEHSTKATLTWKGDELLVEGPGNNFEVLQKIIGKLKKELRAEGVSIAHNTRRKLNQEEAIQTGSILAITGTDVRRRAAGGDISQGDLDVDISDGNVILGDNVNHDKLTQTAKKQGLGLQIGHIFGAGLGNIAAFAGTEDGLPDIFHLFSPEAQALLVDIREKAIKVDGNYEIDVALTEAAGKDLGTISVTIVEGAGPNALTGAQLRVYVEAVRKIVQAEFSRIITQYKLSAPILQQILTRTANILLDDGKPKPIKVRKTGRKSDKAIVETPVYGIDLGKGARTTGRGKSRADFQADDLHLLIDEINRLLHDQIKQNMGKGGAKQLLNYRTGRFARSARVQALYDVKEKGAIGAKVKYMRHPYGVFEPGQRLHKVGRDPHRIFGRSIRQILQERKIANLRRVKVDLRG